MLNKVILIGKISGKPELKYFRNNTIITIIRLLTYEIINGVRQNNWHRIIIKEKRKDLQENMKVLIEGKIKTRRWEQRDKYNYITEIITDDIKIIEENENIKNENEEYEEKNIEENYQNKESEENENNEIEEIKENNYNYYEGSNDEEIE